jgi:reactive intermediate/imine deaminase
MSGVRRPCARPIMQPDTLKEIISFGPAPVSPYSVAVKAGEFIHLSGTLAQDSSGGLVGIGDVAAQTRRTLERMRDVLAAAGSSLDDVVAVTVYLTSAAHFQAMNEVYRSFWLKDFPTRTTIVTGLVLPGALIEISMIAVPRGGERVVVHPEGWAASVNPYSYGIRSGDTLFLAGLVGRRGRDQLLAAGDVRAQTRAIFDNAADILGAAGLSLAAIVSARVFLTDAADFAGMNEVYGEFFPEAPPARATVKSGLPGAGALVEITFVASAAARQAIGTPPAGVPLSPAVRAGHRLYLSGMLGSTPVNAGDIAAETRAVLAKIGATLAAAGASPADVVDGLVYLTDASAFGAMND